jgi:hypothetical protein
MLVAATVTVAALQTPLLGLLVIQLLEITLEIVLELVALFRLELELFIVLDVEAKVLGLFTLKLGILVKLLVRLIFALIAIDDDDESLLELAMLENPVEADFEVDVGVVLETAVDDFEVDVGVTLILDDTLDEDRGTVLELRDGLVVTVGARTFELEDNLDIDVEAATIELEVDFAGVQPPTTDGTAFGPVLGTAASQQYSPSNHKNS